jgi:hypothetical protein
MMMVIIIPSNATASSSSVHSFLRVAYSFTNGFDDFSAPSNASSAADWRWRVLDFPSSSSGSNIIVEVIILLLIVVVVVVVVK